MKMHTLWMLTAVGSSTFAMLSACSLVTDTNATQCSQDSDCSKFAQNAGGAVCKDKLCVVVDGFKGCYPDTPTTNDQLMNACNGGPSPAICIPFDNCATLGLCDGSKPSAPIDPPPAASSGGAAEPDAGLPPRCKDLLAGQRPIYATGSSNFPPFVAAITPLLAKSDPPYRMVWQTSSSCEGVDAAFNVTAEKRRMQKTSEDTWVYSLDAEGKAVRQDCTIDDDIDVDFGESDIYATSCEERLGYRPENPNGPPLVGEYFGPIQAMTIVVPQAASQAAISAEAARAVFGQGRAPTAALPWNDDQRIFNRSDSTATNQIISRAIDVPPPKWWGQRKGTASEMAAAMKSVPAELVEKTIGILGTDLADQNRGNIKVLAFQAAGQGCGFLPDSTVNVADKRNVRDGHYTMWGPLHFFARLGPNGQPSDAAAAFVLRFSVSKLDEELIRSVALTANVPACAMKVTRTAEMGPMTPFEPNFQCGCFYESVATSSEPPGCTRCSTSQDCPDPDKKACNYGFCEKK